MTTLIALYNLFSSIPLVYPLYFFYGAAFLFLGISISVTNMKGSDLKLANGLWMLGVFGFMYGAHEWLELYPLVRGEQLSLQDIYLVKMILLYLLLFSLYFLLQFGLSLISTFDDKKMKRIKAILFIAIVVLSAVIWEHESRVDMPFLWNVEVGIRYTLGPLAGLVNAYGLITYAHKTKNLSMAVSANFFYAGMAFIFYGIFGGIFVFDTTLFDLHLIASFLRGVSAVFISLFILRALNIFNIEMRQKIEQQTRILVQSEKLSSLGRLAAGISHEINNPLTNASLGIQTLKKKFAERNVDPEVLKKIEAVENNIDHASVIARELLQFYRKGGENFAPVKINSVIEGALTLLAYKMENIVLEWDHAPVPDVMGDHGKLVQVFINVLSNSVEAMPKGGRVRISTVQKNDMLQVSVTDTGSGISKENLSKVFDPFFTTKEIGQGTGLGLSISYGIIQQHQGAIEIFGAAGKGTTVIIKIPTRERYEKNINRG
jgi:two-component system NtrC family sensor kinase